MCFVNESGFSLLCRACYAAALVLLLRCGSRFVLQRHLNQAAPSDRERIFERFYRVDHARSRSTGGTGLGLSIVRHVAINHRGTVELESVEGEGSTFRLIFPLAVEPAIPSTTGGN